MKKSPEQDISKLNSILKYLTNIKKCLNQNNIKNVTDLKNDEIAQAACTQFITNIHEAKNKLQDETNNKLTELNKIKLSGARNIASHDYDSVNFAVIFNICKQLTEESIFEEVKEVLSELETEEDEDEN